ncbi:MAG: heterodisulfide reductase subunit A-like protein [Candidatus Methanomethylicia archaeon]|nr:heterodisulfide reductase subunit A-like protein [Candidatus Methanomethylicia archaeon]
MKGLILCVCQGTCPSFSKMNIFEVMNYFRRNKKVDFVAIHPQLCATDGDNFWRVLLSKNDLIDKIIVAGCDPIMQKKMFSWVFKELSFDESKFIGVEIRNMNTEEAIKAIEKEL